LTATAKLDTTARCALRAIASERLIKALVDLAARGLRTHCSDPGTSELWLSESEAERAEAAQLCSGCPVFGPCGEAAEANRERFGVWAGRDVTPLNKPGPIPRGTFKPADPRRFPAPYTERRGRLP
jgi:Transcription factor WhiB